MKRHVHECADEYFSSPEENSHGAGVNPMQRANKQKGFSLIELLIVVAIILILAAIAIPNLIRSKISANEASAVSGIRTINTAEQTYNITYPDIGYADDLSKMGPTTGIPSSTSAGLLDQNLACAAQPCRKNGYLFSIQNVSGSPIVSQYTAVAVPQSIGNSGVRGFCSSQLSDIRYDTTGGTNCVLSVQ
jgi:type IV pilus assembly protein PilA